MTALSAVDGTTTAEGPCSIVIVDDHRSYAEALAFALQHAISDVRVCCADLDCGDVLSDDAVDRLRQAALVVLDWQLCQSDGLDVTRRLRRGDGAPHVVMVSGHHSPAFERMAMRAGAFAAISKHAPVSEIVGIINRCRSGREHVPSASAMGAIDAGSADVLTERQVEVLWMLSSGLDVQQIAGRLYLSVATVRSYVRDALRRLDAHSQLEAVAKARRAGLIPVESTPPAAGRA